MSALISTRLAPTDTTTSVRPELPPDVLKAITRMRGAEVTEAPAPVDRNLWIQGRVFEFATREAARKVWSYIHFEHTNMRGVALPVSAWYEASMPSAPSERDQEFQYGSNLSD